MELRLGSLGAALFCHWARLQRKPDKMYRETETKKGEWASGCVSGSWSRSFSRGSVSLPLASRGHAGAVQTPLFTEAAWIGLVIFNRKHFLEQRGKSSARAGDRCGEDVSFWVGVHAGHTGSGRKFVPGAGVSPGLRTLVGFLLSPLTFRV